MVDYQVLNACMDAQFAAEILVVPVAKQEYVLIIDKAFEGDSVFKKA